MWNSKALICAFTQKSPSTYIHESNTDLAAKAIIGEFPYVYGLNSTLFIVHFYGSFERQEGAYERIIQTLPHFFGHPFILL